MSVRTEPLRAHVIVRPHTRHDQDCVRDCGATFVCRGCRKRNGDCRRDFFFAVGAVLLALEATP